MSRLLPVFNRPVLICLTGLARGGLEAHVLTLAQALRNRGDCPFHIVCHFDAWFMQAALRDGLPVTLLPLRNRLDSRVLREFEDFVRRTGFSLIHAHDKRILLAARRAARRLRLPLLSTYHGWVSSNRWVHFTNWLDLRLRLSWQRFIAVSPQIAEELRRTGVPADRIAVIPNSVDPAAFASLRPREQVRAAEGFRESDFVVGTASRLSLEKRPDLLVRAFARFHVECPEARLLVIGDGPLRAASEDLARGSGLAEAVRFTGFRNDVPSLLNALDVFVLSSQTEGTSQALVEAMWLGRPIVATRVGGVPSQVEHDREALLAPSGDAAALAWHLLSFRRDPDLRRRLGEAAQRRAQAEFSAELMAERTVRVYQEALADGVSPRHPI